MENDKRIIRFVPNALTILRIFLTVIFLAMIIMAGRMEDAKPGNFMTVGFVLFIITALTDIVDGKVARMFDVTSKFGRIADPLADKLLVCGAFLCFAISGQPKLSNFAIGPLWLCVIHWGTFSILTIRELGVTIMRHVAESRGVNFGAVWSGKLKMFLQSFGVGTVVIGWGHVSREWGDWFTVVVYVLMVSLTVMSGIQACRRPIK
jgi:CDP-diacylglycerol--glycerol-3-phosphate 3-phosphatidyltransferase